MGWDKICWNQDRNNFSVNQAIFSCSVKHLFNEIQRRIGKKNAFKIKSKKQNLINSMAYQETLIMHIDQCTN